MHSLIMKKTHAKFHNNRYKTVRGVALTRGTNRLYIKGEKWLSSQCGKRDKNDLRIISKPRAHPHTKKKTYAKFQNNRYKTVRGVALTRGTYCLYIDGEKWISSQCGKSDKNVLTIIPKPHAHPHTMKKIYAKFQKDRYKTIRVSKRPVQNYKRSCAHKRYLLPIYWWWKMNMFTIWKKWQWMF